MGCSSESAQEKGKTGWNSVITKTNWWFSEFPNANVLFCRFYFESHLVYDQTQGQVLFFFNNRFWNVREWR
jgi:hypothetical protein